MANNINAQDYIDSVYGKNKERDAKDNHSYYLSVIQDLLHQKSNIKEMLQTLKNEVNNGKR